MRKEIGKWFMDIAKYIAMAVLISSFLGSFQQKWIMYIIGALTIVLSFGIGIFLINDKKIK
jgi:low affinity Fe/Cu permease